METTRSEGFTLNGWESHAKRSLLNKSRGMTGSIRSRLRLPWKAEKLATEPKQVQSFFDAQLEMATEQTREAGEFTIPGLGKLVKAERRERMGRNPQTGEEIKIAAKTTVKFRIEGSYGRDRTFKR